jgi:cysteine-rich repeat protein
MVDPITGAFQSSFYLGGSKSALTWAGSRGTIFVRVDDGATVTEVLPDGTVVNTITTPVNMSGLAFSSGLNRLFGVVTGQLYGLDPDSGALLPGYPVSVTDSYGYSALKTGAAAADEIPAACGDEQVNADGETCDPPGTTQPNGNVCRADCTFCGDGVPDQGEACDAGAQNSDTAPNACRRDCTLPSCGDGVVDAGEQCDPGAIQTETAAPCRPDCTQPRCGDEILDAGESCDDGNEIDGDGCSASCTTEFCGDGIVQPLRGEGCEPPSTEGCNAQCQRIEICNNQVDDDQNGAIDCEEPLCACLPIERDPGIIRFGEPGAGKDYFSVHGSFSPVTAIEPTSEPVGIMLANEDGTIYAAEMPAGAVLGRRGKFKYRNAGARTARNGVYKLDIRFRPRSGNYVFWLKAYGDLSAATTAVMTLQWHVGDDAFVNTSAWERTNRGWELHLPGE